MKLNHCGNVIWIRIFVAVFMCLGVGGIGAATSIDPSLDGWFNRLQRPSFAPPNWLFGPVWSVLYVMMGVAAAGVWQAGARTPEVRRALVLFLIQLVCNGIWSPLFFGAHRIGWAFVDIILLWVAISFTIQAFYRVARWTAWVLLPYWGWVTFATALNAAYWKLNP